MTSAVTGPARPEVAAAPAPVTSWPRTAVPAPPRSLVVVAAVALAAGVAIAVVGAWRTGVSWDETYHVVRMRNYLEHGWYLLDQDLDGSAPGAWVDQRYVYAPATMGLLHAWSMLWGVDGAGTVEATDQAYAVRHLGVVLISFVGVVATAVVVRLLLGSWAWALVCAGVLVAVPTWTGHAMFNIKDVPVATGYTLVTLGLVVVLRAHRREGWVVAGVATTVAGLVLAIGTRPGIWPGLALAGGVVVLVLVLGREWRRAAALLAAPVLALGILTLVYPAAFSTPVTALVEGALSSANYDGKQGAWYYLPLFLVIELPTLMLVLGGAGAVIVVRRLARSAKRPGRELSHEAAWLVVLLQAFALPAIAVLRESNLYTGLRQLLFAAPALAVLVTVALAALVRWRVDATASAKAPWRRGLVPTLGGAAIVVPLLVQVQLFPYSYAFSSVPAAVVSPIAAAQDRDLEVQTDYWRTSVRELAPSVPRAGFVTCTPQIDDDERFLPRSSESREDCSVDLIGPLAPYDALRPVAAGDPDPARFVAVDAGSAFVGSNCDVLEQVTRRLWWREVPMSTVARCDLVLEPLPGDGRVAFAGDGSGAAYLRGSWAMNRALPGAGLGAESGEIGFALPTDATSGLSLSLSGTGLAGASLAANGAPLTVLGDDVSLHAEMSPAVVSLLDAGRVVLTLSTPTPGALRLTDLRVARLSEVAP
ncbi:hypothetical protein [Nocardioides sp.]|uniref:hypothetical protein n=1 Tax=Nocardioides sp. TaxID=35761 RepID=UPI0026030960|nr:hypothetical protein [Nocardioides sp.]